MEKAGPLLTVLENTMSSSVNPESDDDIQNLLQQILTCTPPFKKIEKSNHSIPHLDGDTDSEFDSLVPIFERPQINHQSSKNNEIKKALEYGNIRKCRQLLQSSGINYK